MATIAGVSSPARPDCPLRALLWSARLLVATSWVSGFLFGTYILLFFGGTALAGTAERWNDSLAGLHDAAMPLATIAIGAHFATGGVLLLLGPVQLIGRLRRAYPALHRWLGRLYVLSAGAAGLGGLAFILGKGTIGGAVMDLGFGLYGAFMVACAVLTFAHARAGRVERHRAWAIRLFALTVASWLYRMEYGFWIMTADTGMTAGFDGWFDRFMAFTFYLPNLAIAELFIRARRPGESAAERLGAAAVLLAASASVVLATFVFMSLYWAPGMVSGVTGASL